MLSFNVYSRILIRTGLFLSALTLIGACSPKDKTPRGSGDPVIGGGRNNGGGNTGGGTATPGTTDGTGGNGLRGKVLESFIKDPRSLRGFEVHLKPIFDNLESQYEKIDKEKAGPFTSATTWFLLKKWYLLPMRLKCSDKNVIGVSFAQDGVDQLACQTADEVYIDSEITKLKNLHGIETGSDDREFAYLVLHEYFVNLYTMRFAKMSKILNFFKSLDPDALKNNVENQDGTKRTIEFELSKLDELMPAEPERKLSKEDYVIIRRVTDHVFNNGKTMTAQAFDTLLTINGFDTRFNGLGSEFKLPDIPAKGVSQADIKRIIKMHSLLGHDVEECRKPEGGLIAPCTMTMDVLQTGLTGATLKVSIKSGNREIDFFGSIGTETDFTAMTDGVRPLVQLTASDLTNWKTKKIGDTFSMISLHYRPNSSFNDEKLDLLQRMDFDSVQIAQFLVVNTFERELKTDGADIATKEHCLSLKLAKSADPFKKSFAATVKRTREVPSFSLLIDAFNEPVCFPIFPDSYFKK